MNNLAYCNECEDLVEFTSREEDVTEVFHGKSIHYKFNICRCKECNSEVAGSIDYNYDKSEAKWNAFLGGTK